MHTLGLSASVLPVHMAWPIKYIILVYTMLFMCRHMMPQHIIVGACTSVQTTEIKYILFCIGPRVMRLIRSDIDLKYRREIGDGVMSNYLYHCNAQNPT